MIQVFAHLRDGRFVVAVKDQRNASSAQEWARFAEEFDPADHTHDLSSAWFDLEKPTAEELQWLQQTFHFHPLAIEDCTHFDQRPKIEKYSDHLFLVVHGLQRAGAQDKLDLFELHCFLAENLVVTVHDGTIDSINQYKARLTKDRNQLPFQEDMTLHRILDLIQDANPAVLTGVENEIELLDEQVLTAKTDTAHLEKIHSLQHQLNSARHVLSPQKDVFRPILVGAFPDLIPETSLVYFRDINDHLIRTAELVDELRETLWGIRDVYLAVAAQRTNEAMKRLTLFSVIFLPLTFITGFFGMNFTGLPFGSNLLLWLTSALVVLLPFGMISWFRTRNWL